MTRNCALAVSLLLALAAPANPQDARGVDCEKHLSETVQLIRDWWAFYIFKVGAFDLDGTAGALEAEAAEALTADACADVLDRFVASLGDGHANLTSFPGRTPRSVPRGLELRRFKDRIVRPGRSRPDQRLYVVAVDTAVPAVRDIAVGSLVLEIDGAPAPDVLDSVQLRVSGSTLWNREHWTDAAALRGPAGTEVAVKLRAPDGALQDVRLPRPALPTDEKERERYMEAYADTLTLVEWKRLDGDVGYLRLTSFYYPRAVKEFDDALEQLRDTRGLILDMRGNGGGRVDVLQQLVGRFFQRRQTQIARLLQRRPGSTYVSRAPEPLLANRRKWPYTAPVVMLVDAGCFSACDLFANAMDENERAILIGPTPTGGGSASPINWAVLPQWDGVSVRASFTVALRQDESHIESRGVRPHVVVAPSLDDYMKGRDPILERGVEAIRSGQARPLATD